MGEIMTTREMAEYLRSSPGTVKRLARAGRLPGLKLGHTWRFRKSDIDELFTERVVDQALAEEAERRLAAAREEDFVPWERVKAESEALP